MLRTSSADEAEHDGDVGELVLLSAAEVAVLKRTIQNIEIREGHLDRHAA